MMLESRGTPRMYIGLESGGLTPATLAPLTLLAARPSPCCPHQGGASLEWVLLAGCLEEWGRSPHWDLIHSLSAAQGDRVPKLASCTGHTPVPAPLPGRYLCTDPPPIPTPAAHQD